MKLSWRFLFLPLAFLVFSLALYWRSVHAFFVSDDAALLYPCIKYGAFLTSPPGHEPRLRPFFGLGLWMDWKLAGLNPVWYHLHNIILHGLNSAGVALVAFLLQAAESDEPEAGQRVLITSLLAGLVFLVLPSHAESVAWVAGRSDLIGIFWGLMAFAAYLWWRRGNHWGWLVAGSVSLLFGLLGKENIVTFAFMLVAYEAYAWLILKQKLSTKQVLIACVPFFIALAIYLIARYLSTGSLIGTYGAKVHLHFTLVDVRTNLFSFLSRSFTPGLSRPKFLVAAVVVAVACAGVSFGLKRRFPRLVWFLAIAWLMAVAPVINLGFSGMDVSPQSERLVHWATAFSSIAIVLIIGHLLPNLRVMAVASGCLIVLYGGLLVQQVENWRAAGDIAYAIFQSAKELPETKRLFVVTVPDNIHGAYIQRNGFQETLEMHGVHKFGEVVIMTRQNLYSREDDTSVEVKGNQLIPRLNSEKGRGTRFNMAVGSINKSASPRFTFDPKSWGDNDITLTLTEPEPGERYTYYKGGKMVELVVPAAP